MAMTSSRETIASVNRRGGGGHGGGHASSMGMHGGENGEHGNLPRPLGTNPVYAGAAAGSAHQRNNNHHHGKSNGTLNYVCFIISLFCFFLLLWEFLYVPKHTYVCSRFMLILQLSNLTTFGYE